jgi:hypothetical protein
VSEASDNRATATAVQSAAYLNIVMARQFVLTRAEFFTPSYLIVWKKPKDTACFFLLRWYNFFSRNRGGYK